MKKTMKFWSGLGAAAITGTVVAHAAILDHQAKSPVGKPAKLWQLADTAGEGGEAGEAGESGESGGDDRLDYLTDLGLVEGHMRVGIALYKAGQADAAKTHMKHPGDELYEDLKAHFDDLKVKGFAAELAAVADLVEKGGAAAEVDAAMTALVSAISASRGVAMTSAETAQVIHMLVRNAADEYVAGVKDGKVTDAHEYQDAWGFVETAKAYLASVPADERTEHAGPFGEIEGELAKLAPAWLDLAGGAPVTADPTLLPAAAARIELAALAIK